MPIGRQALLELARLFCVQIARNLKGRSAELTFSPVDRLDQRLLSVCGGLRIGRFFEDPGA